MQTLLRAAVTLRPFDHLAAGCTRGPWRGPTTTGGLVVLDGNGYARRGE